MYHLEQEFAISQSQLAEELELQVKLCEYDGWSVDINDIDDINLCLSVAVLQQINMDHLQWSVAQYHGPLSTEFSAAQEQLLSIHCQIQFLVY